MFNVNPMQWDKRTKITALVFIGLIIAIPSLAFLIRQRVSFSSSAKPPEYKKPVTQEATSSGKKTSSLLNDLEDTEDKDSASSGVLDDLSFDSTLSFSLKIEGRPENNMATKLVIMLASGGIIPNPKYILTLSKDVPASGTLSGISLSGISLGTQYSVYLKAPAQLSAGSTFSLASGNNSLNGGQPVNLITGDLNEDNTINTLDYNIVKNALGKTPQDSGWNGILDLNLDNIINTLDLSIVRKNLNKVGDGGVYVSKVSTSSAILAPLNQGGTYPGPINEATTSAKQNGGGYWLWIPEIGD